MRGGFRLGSELSGLQADLCHGRKTQCQQQQEHKEEGDLCPTEVEDICGQISVFWFGFGFSRDEYPNVVVLLQSGERCFWEGLLFRRVQYLVTINPESMLLILALLLKDLQLFLSPNTEAINSFSY